MGARAKLAKVGSRVVAAIGVGLLGTAVLVGVSATPSGATPSTWSVAQLPQQAGVNNDLNAVSCPAAGQCVAVGRFGYVGGTGSGGPALTLMDTLSGGHWSTSSGPDVANRDNTLWSVSCPAVSDCVAVGGTEDFLNLIDATPIIDTLSNGTLTAVTAPSVPGGSLYGVSCPTTSTCVAVGQIEKEYPAQPQVLIETLNNGVWSNTSPGSAGELLGVSCSSATSCVAVGNVSAVLKGGSWTVGHFGIANLDDNDGLMRSVSCTTKGCVAAGELDTSVQNINNSTPQTALYENGSWSSMSNPSPTNSGPTNDAYFESISCADVTDCTAVGHSTVPNDYPAATTALAETLTGHTWTISSTPNPAGTAKPIWNTLNGVSCPAAGQCVAVGEDNAIVPGNIATLDHAMALESQPLTAAQSGYDLVGSDGGVFVLPGKGGGFYGSLPGLGVHVSNIVGIVPSADDKGYFLVGSDGGVFSFGDTHFAGSLPGLNVHVSNIVGIVPTADDKGYFLVGADGGVFSFGDSSFEGSLPGSGVHVNDVVGIAATADDRGYWVVRSNGSVYHFGDAGNQGSAAALGSPASGIAGTSTGGGYWIVGQNGGVAGLGDARSFGSLPALHIIPSLPVVALVPTVDDGGYWLIGKDGGVFSFGDAPNVGSLPGLRVNVSNIVGAAPTHI